MRACLCALACLVVGIFICFFALCTGQTANNCVVNNMCWLHISVCASVLCFPEMERGKDLDHWRRAA